MHLRFQEKFLTYHKSLYKRPQKFKTTLTLFEVYKSYQVGDSFNLSWLYVKFEDLRFSMKFLH